ncbi:hypothetical protein FIA58_008660 [Flavobacterium jejuense]|uniref:MoxR-vWA-beta-propeller ternary system domain-containing protein n=1 Tax=Flavobacterium jejuense TaxID=1544455 RepID=A0ABX0IQA8_9FLAO|nr:hypothetical protein [Flavobacterium jejuense]NHN25743.1 hypothetical protein [Flavobacterium jejuense]
MNEKKIPFLDTIYHLRSIEHAIIYDKKLDISKEEEKEVIELLKDEYEKEKLNYPFQAPVFDEVAALWGSKIVYFATQLVLNREDTASKISTLFPDFGQPIIPSAMLSADLCLRFLPQLLLQLQLMDADDMILPVLEQKLKQFPYSGIGYEMNLENIDLSVALSDACLTQLFLDRVVEKKDKNRGNLEVIKPLLLANFGDYKTIFWNEL